MSVRSEKLLLGHLVRLLLQIALRSLCLISFQRRLGRLATLLKSLSWVPVLRNHCFPLPGMTLARPSGKARSAELTSQVCFRAAAGLCSAQSCATGCLEVAPGCSSRSGLLSSVQEMYHCSRCDDTLLNTGIIMMGCHHSSVVLSQTLRPEQQQLSTRACGEQ